MNKFTNISVPVSTVAPIVKILSLLIDSEKSSLTDSLTLIVESYSVANFREK